MIYGYARVSTLGQGKTGNSLEEQEQKLNVNGCQEIYAESYTGTTTARPEFTKLLELLQAEDTLVVTKLDRLARNVKEGIEVIQSLLARNVKVHVLNVGLLDNTPIGKFFITTLLAVAELERSMIVERTKAGKAVARTKAGFKEGRPRTDAKIIDQALRMLDSGLSYKEVSDILKISKATLGRARKEHREKLIMKEEGLQICM